VAPERRKAENEGKGDDDGGGRSITVDLDRRWDDG
jgi:hypothetical protein